MRSIRICLILHSAEMWGAERSSLELIDALRVHGWDCFVVLPRGGPLIRELKRRGLTFGIVPYKWWVGKSLPLWKQITYALWNILMIIPVAIKLSRWKCNIVITNTITTCVGAFAANLLRRPHVWYIREFGYEDHGLHFHLGSKLSHWLMDRLSSVFIANSQSIAHKYQRYLTPSKLKLVYQPVILNKALFDEQLSTDHIAKIKCILVGSIRNGKRQEDAVRAIANLVRKGKSVELNIIGEGDQKYKEYLFKIINENKIEKNVKFSGYVENPLPFIKNSDVLLMCSKSEAFGRVTIEAMKAGKPVIGARSGGTAELIQEGFNGLLYEPLNYKDLANKIEYFCENPELAKQMGKNAQQWATKRFNQARYGQEIMSILEPLIKA